MAVRITCINKDGGNHSNPYEGITDFGWVNEETRATGKSSREQMVKFLKQEGGSAYVKDLYGDKVFIGVVDGPTTPYLRTYANGAWTDNLLSLGEC